jgi:hypothetical protein
VHCRRGASLSLLRNAYVTHFAIAANAGSARSFWRALRYAANRETDLLMQSGTYLIRHLSRE